MIDYFLPPGRRRRLADVARPAVELLAAARPDEEKPPPKRVGRARRAFGQLLAAASGYLDRRSRRSNLELSPNTRTCRPARFPLAASAKTHTARSISILISFLLTLQDSQVVEIRAR